MLPIGPCAGVIYSWLFKYIQQHTAGFYREQMGPVPPKAGPVRTITWDTGYYINES